jgi:predicted exporter
MHGQEKGQNSAEHFNTWISLILSSSLILYMLWLRHSSKISLILAFGMLAFGLVPQDQSMVTFFPLELHITKSGQG